METEAKTKRMYKSSKDRFIDGVCGGVAEYFGIDSSLVRVAWVLIGLVGGIGVLLYFVAIVIMPAPLPADAAEGEVGRKKGHSAFLIAGMVLVVLGAVLFLKEADLLPWDFHVFRFAWSTILPVLLILGGLFLLLRKPSPKGSGEGEAGEKQEGQEVRDVPPLSADVRRLYRSRRDRKFFGVCGGLGDYLDIDPTLVRLFFVISGFASLGFTLVAYILLSILVREEPLQIPSV